ncbi:hypothetical protein H0H93_004479 [Arthromyces matolae]|nr:hypothetical protein H0H93_004479 [Arthromyces matolae]
MEAAASLFGSDEPGADPFASLGGETYIPESSSNGQDNMFHADDQSNNVDFFNNSQEQNPFPADDGSQYLGSTTAYSTESTYAHSTVDTGSQYGQQGQYADLYSPYLISLPSRPFSTKRSIPETTQTQAAVPQPQPLQPASNSYDPYAPSITSYNPPATTQSYAANNYAPSQPLAPATTSTYSPYTPQSSTSQTLSSQYTPYHPGAAQTYPVSQAEQTPLPVHVPSAPLVAKATVNRPKVSNAYDPPFPTVSKKKTTRVVSAQNPFGYGGYDTMSPVPAYGLPASQTAPYLSQQAAPDSHILSQHQRAPPPPFPHATTPPQRVPPNISQALPPPPQRLPPPVSQATPPPPPHTIPQQQYPALHPPLPPQPPYRAESLYAPQSEHQQGVARKGDLTHASDYGSETLYGMESEPSDGVRKPDYLMQSSEYGQVPPRPNVPDASYGTQNEALGTLANADDLANGSGLGYASFDPEGAGEISEGYYRSSWDQSTNVTAAPHADAQNNVLQNEDLDGIVSNVSPENATIPLSYEHSQPPSEMPHNNNTNHPAFSRSLTVPTRSDSPRHFPLPPSPLVNYQGRSSPFGQPNLLGPKRTASPASFVEPSREKVPDHDPYAPPPRDTTRTLSSHPPVNGSSPATKYGNDRNSSLGLSNTHVPKDPPSKTKVSAYSGERTTSPAARPLNGAPPPPKSNPYAPAKPDLRNRSMSNSSLLSSSSISAEDPYAPRKQLTSDSNNNSWYNQSTQSTKVPDYPALQELSVNAFQTPYAPSPSLMGANDPLGRTSARVPVFSFGFGGKIVTCFHGADSLNTGFDVALAARNSTGVQIRVMNKIIPDPVLDASSSSFPGPLFGETGTATTSLVRTGANSQTKTKKGKVVQYLSAKTDELALGLRYLKPDSIESQQAEGKLVLVKLLQLMVEHDGRLTGTSELDNAVRVALVPRLEGSFGRDGFIAVADTSPPGLEEPHEKLISVTSLRPSTLNKLQDFLLRGERRQAYRLALDEKLWAHAMVIASSIDKDAWKEVVQEFARTELADDSLSPSSGRESIRVAYSLFSGQGADAVQELAPQNLLARATIRPAGPQAAPHLTPRTPSFAVVPAQGPTIPPQALSRWAETAAMLLSSPLSPESSAALTALGDQLAANQIVAAAHVCYLLAPQTSPLGGLGHPSARITLLGSRNPQTSTHFSKDPDPLIFSEIVEFALSLATPIKGQDAFTGIPHLQAYRFIRAVTLAEVGDIKQAQKYCEAITATIGRGSSAYATPVFMEQLKGLSDRISGIHNVDKSFWIGAKLSKPSLDSIGGWLEGRFTKLVTGDVDLETTPEETIKKPDDGGFVGPFSHYSAISSTTPSARSSPQPSVQNLNVLPPARSGSAMAYSPPQTNPLIDRASSATDYTRPKPPLSEPRVVSANASTTSFPHAPSFGQVLNAQEANNRYSPSDDLVTPRPSFASAEDNSGQEASSWWSGTAYAEGPATAAPTVSTFMHVDEGALSVSESADGFISLVDQSSYSIATGSSSRNSTQNSPRQYDDEIEDLGFGNSSNRPQRDAREGARGEPSSNGNAVSSAEPTVPEPVAPPPATEDKAAASSGWFGRWWKKGDAPSSGPVKASLGEESSFYYDKDLKRWVNKKAGAETAKVASPPPPPARAQTASPAMTGPRPPPPSEFTPPSNRSTSAIDLSTSPPSRTTMRVRSNLVPTPESAPSTPTGTRLGPGAAPPPSRPRSQASAKRNIRNRYVDVFQQEGAT